MVNSTILTPNSRKVRRKNELGKERSPAGTNDSTTEFCWTTPTASDSKKESAQSKFSLRWKSWNWGNFQAFTLVCLGAALALSYFYYVTTIFETVTRFSHLSNLERELSLPTTVAFRYSFYKKIADADSYVEGLRSVIYDTNTDWPRSTNSFQKHSLTTEAVLGAGFHLLKKFQEWTNLKLSNCWLSRHSESGTGGNGDEAFSCTGLGDTLHFYLYAFWAIESVIVSLLFYFGLTFSNSAVGGITSALLFMVTHPQRSNYEWIFPLEEKIGSAAAFVQIFILSHFILRHRSPSWTGCVKIALSTSVLLLTWKTEAQWILLSQLIIVSLLHFASLISRYTASLIIFGQITGWQYASLVSFDSSFIHWSFFLYVLMAAIVTIFLVEPILDWVFGDKIEKWMFLRSTILLISFQMILISVRCDFGQVVGLKEDNRFPFSIGVMEEPGELRHLNTEIKPTSLEQSSIGYFPSASAEMYDKIVRFQTRLRKKDQWEITPETPNQFVSTSTSIDDSQKVSARPLPFYRSHSKYEQSQSHQMNTLDKTTFPLPQMETKSIYDTLKERKSRFQQIVPILGNSKYRILKEKDEISKEMGIGKEEVEHEQQGTVYDEKLSLQRDSDDIFNRQFSRFIRKCFGSPLKFSLQAFCAKYILLLLACLYVLVSGVLLPAAICYQNDKIERDKMKALRSKQKRNGENPFGPSAVFDLSIFYNCYYRFLNAKENGSFAKKLGFTVKDDRETIIQYYWNPAILYGTTQLGFLIIYCCFLDKHWELLFIIQLCVFLSLLGDYKRVKTVFGKFSCGYSLGTNLHWFIVFGILSVVFATSRVNFDRMYQNSRGKFETSSPKISDLVEAVKWIRMNSGTNSSFAGVENLMTIVYLSAQRPCVNHHHSAHLLTPETVEINGRAGKKTTLPPEFPIPTASNVVPSERLTMKQSEMIKKKMSLNGVFVEIPTTDEKSYDYTEANNFEHTKVDSKDGTEPNAHSRFPLLNTDPEFEKREQENLYKVYSMFSQGKSISEFHDGLVSLNVSYLFLSRELCSPPDSSASSMFFDNESSKKEKTYKSFSSYGIWAWEESTIEKDYAHWQQIGKDCDFISFWDSIEELYHKENKREKETVAKPTEILCFQLMNERNIKPFTRSFENGFYTILATNSN